MEWMLPYLVVPFLILLIGGIYTFRESYNSMTENRSLTGRSLMALLWTIALIAGTFFGYAIYYYFEEYAVLMQLIIGILLIPSPIGITYLISMFFSRNSKVGSVMAFFAYSSFTMIPLGIGILLSIPTLWFIV